MPEEKILFIATHKLIQNVVASKFEKEGYHVLTTSDGFEAIGLIASEKFDLVVTEELLPSASGFEVLKACKDAQVPSIIISETDLENKIFEAFDLGVQDFIDKPYNPIDLLVRVKSILNHHEE